MLLSQLFKFLKINEFMNKFDLLLKKYNLTYAHIIIDEPLSNTLYGNIYHAGEEIHLLELKDLLEPGMRYRSKL